MSFLKKKFDDYLLKLLGDKAIFDQEATLEIKKKNDYYEQKLALPEVLGQMNTPAPVVGDITTMTDPMPSVRLPRIPYYEYIYYLMRWNSSVLRMIGFKLKQEIFRETRLHGPDWEEKFKTKCVDCGTEFDEQLEECDYCHSKNVVPPDANQKKLLDPFLKEANKAEQTLLEVFEEEEDDLNTVDDGYLIFIKEYFVGPGGIFGKVKEIMRGDPSRFRIVSDVAGRRGGKWFVCPAHRKSALKPNDYKTKPLCDQCGLPLQDVHYVETSAGGVTPVKYYIKGEVVHSSKYEPSRLYGIPPMFSVYIIARTIQLMDLYTEEYYEKGRLQGLLGIATENKVELKKWIEETMTRLRNDPHYLPVIALDVGPDRGKSRMEFIKLVDNMDELKFQEHRRMLKEEIAGLFGVSLIFLADSSIGGGLNNEGLQITVTDRTIEWGQSIYHDQFFPKICEFLGITDWKLKLKPSKETDEMAELERFDLRIDSAGKLQKMGYQIELRDDKFEIRGKAHVYEHPEQMGGFGGGFGSGDDSGSSKKPENQEGKPDKPKPDKEIKRSMEKAACRGRVPTTKGFHPYYCPSEKMTFEFFVDSEGQAWYIGAKDENDKDISRHVTLGNAKTAFGWYGQEVKDGRGKIMKSDDLMLARMSSKFIEEVNHIALGGLFRNDWNRLSTEGKHGIKRKLWSNHGEGWFNMSFNSKKVLVQREINSILQKSMPRDLQGLKDRFNRCNQMANPNPHEINFCKSVMENLMIQISRKQQILSSRAGGYRNLSTSQKREYDDLNALAIRIRRNKRMFKSDDEFPGQDISDELRAEIEAHLDQAFSNPDNFVYVDVPDTTKDYHFMPQIQAFDLERVNDESGQSGTGIVLSGIIFSDGKVVVRWNTETASTTVFDSWEDFESIHISTHPGNETKVHYYQLNKGDTQDFAKSVVEPGRKVIADYKKIEHNFAKQLEDIYLMKLAKKIEKLDDKSANRLIKEIDSIVTEATPLIEKIAFSEVLRAYKKGKQIDESRDVSKTIDLPDNLTEPFRAEYGAFGLDKSDWQVLRAIYRRNPFWKAFTGMSQSVSDKLKEHITESYEAPNTARMKATIRDVKKEYPNISKERAEIIAYGRIGKFSIAKVLGMMKRTVNAETYRLERIARTESTAITSKGREMQFKQTDPEGNHRYDWFGPNDKRNSEECPEIKRRIAIEGNGRGVSLERALQIQKDVVQEFNRMRKTDFIYRDWLPHINCRHGLRRIV